MSLTSGRVTVGTAVPVQIDGSSANPVCLCLYNEDNTKAIYVGGPTVSVSTGMKLSGLERLNFELRPGNALFAISDSGDHAISFVTQKDA
jgi:hypothetical protein